jgi:2-C-methyl-D-erythritol 4-phosphate cytidylyltransferase / 2-C-methyl-D-erythritol 2,4-cyclodiphosphate synthase
MPINFIDSTLLSIDPTSGVVYAIVPAGGSGSRVGANMPKQYLELFSQNGRSVTVIEEAVSRLLGCSHIAGVVVVVAPDDKYADNVFSNLLKVSSKRLDLLFEGGVTRRSSVLAGCRYIKRNRPSDARETWCLVHDAARPGVTEQEVQRMIETLIVHSVGGILATPIADTVKQAQASAGNVIQRTLDRSLLWSAQTPQMFRIDMLLQALETNESATDEASAIEALGFSPLLLEGGRQNFKITTKEDLGMMRALKMNAYMHKVGPGSMRVGQGYDSHALVPGRPLILGGIRIACDRGLLGHSDADALLHAITDAVIGATGKGDIGRWFPDTSAAFAGADSAELLRQVMVKTASEGWLVGNVDATIIAQSPKLEPYMQAMVEKIASVLNVDASQVNVKAKTNEKLGHLGRGEAIAAHAVVMLFRDA